MSKQNIKKVITALSNSIIITTIVFLLAILAIWCVVFIEIKADKEQLVHRQLGAIVKLYQNNLSEKLSIVASTLDFRQYLQLGDNTKNDAYYRFLDELVTLKDESIVGSTIYYVPSPYMRGLEPNKTKLIFTYGKKTHYYVTLKLCYLNDRLDAELGICQNTWTLYFSKPALLGILKSHNNDLLMCTDNCHTINLLPTHSLGSFPVITSSRMQAHLNLRQPTSNLLLFIIIGATVILVIILSLIIAMRIRQIVSQFIAEPLDRIITALKRGQLPEAKTYIDELKFLADQIKRSYEEMDKIEIANVARQAAHDLRSPIIAIESVLKKTNHPTEEQLYTIKTAMQQIHDIINNLVQKNVSTASINYAHLRDVMLIPTINYVLSEKNSELEDNQRSHIKITSEIDTASHTIFVKIIPEVFKRVLSNIFNNAIESLQDRQDGCITLTVHTEKDEVILSIRDNGCGIPKEYLNSIFDEGVSYKEQGSGLGLFHAKESLKQWRGKISIESAVDQGTTVTIRLLKQPPAVWFTEGITILPDTHVVIVDDSESFHNQWKQRMQDVGIDQSKLMHFYSPDTFLDWYHENAKATLNYLYLIDQEFTGVESTGIQLIEHMSQHDQCFLVTTHNEQVELQNACERLNIKLIPKHYVFSMPIQRIDRLPNHVLLAKDHFLGEAWEYRILALNQTIQCYYCASRFMSDLRLYPLNAKIFIVREFEAIAIKTIALGYTDVTVLTHDPETYQPLKGMKVAAKEFDFTTLIERN